MKYIDRIVVSFAVLLLSVASVTAHAAPPGQKVTLYLTDAQGTVVAEMTPQGQVTYEAAYRPYGQQVEGMPQDGPGYTGRVNDADTGLVYMQQRYYNPIGRMLSVDPVGPTPGDVFSFNRYAYANNNPITNIDPDGRATVGENIDQYATAAARSGNHFKTYMWAFAGVTWKAIGAESLSQVVDKGSSASTGDKLGAGFEVISVLPPIKIAAEVKVAVESATAGMDVAKASARFSPEKAALVDMAKADAKSGATRADMKAYQELNDQLPDRFPSNKVRIDEGHPTRGSHSQKPHGHVGPVNHIPIKDEIDP